MSDGGWILLMGNGKETAVLRANAIVEVTKYDESSVRIVTTQDMCINSDEVAPSRIYPGTVKEWHNAIIRAMEHHAASSYCFEPEE